MSDSFRKSSQNKQSLPSKEMHQYWDITSEASNNPKATKGEFPSKTSAYEKLFDSGYDSTTVSKTSIDFENEFEAKLSISSSNIDDNAKETSKKWTDSGVCITESGLSIDNTDCNSSTNDDNESVNDDLIDYSDDAHSGKSRSALYVRDAYQQDVDGDTLLHMAIINGLHDVSCVLIRIAPHPDFLDIYNHLLQTPLHLAVLTQQSNIVRRLMICGATIDLRDRHGNTPLHISCRLSDFESVRALLSPISEKEVRDAVVVNYPIGVQSLPIDLLQLRNYEGETCIHLAAFNLNKKIIEFLVQSGADINAQDGKSGKSALHFAVETQKPEFVQFLVKRCRANVNLKSYAGHTPLYLAWSLFRVCSNNSKLRSIIQFLSDSGGEPSLPPNDTDSDSDVSDDE